MLFRSGSSLGGFFSKSTQSQIITSVQSHWLPFPHPGMITLSLGSDFTTSFSSVAGSGGEVEAPGVYELPASSRIGEAVEAAGGMTEEAADTFLNLAGHMTDGQKIEVPSREDAKALKEQQEQQEGGLVNLNTAAKEQLMTLTGIGESKAEDILDYREQNGGFRTKEDLMQIPGIKERVFEKIKDQITV